MAQTDFAFWLLVCYLSFTCLVVYTLLCGELDFHRNGCVGWLHRVLTHKLWVWLRAIGQRLCGQKVYSYVDKASDWFCNRPNPLLMFFYLTLVIGGSSMFVIYAFPYIPGPLLSGWHIYTFLAQVGITLYSFHYVSTKDPGAVTPQNEEEYAHLFPYDNLIFEKKYCESCKITRPARAKHCSICKRCVSRFDHHCAWINTDVGLHNIREFLIFLLMTALLTAYASWMIYYIEKGILTANGLLDYTYTDAAGATKSLSWGYLFQVLIVHTAPVVGLGMFCVLVTIVLLAFLFYHLWLIKENTTTNETFKWKDLKYEIKLQEEFKKKAEAEGKRIDPRQLRPIRPEDIRNIYNRGIVANFKEALFPYSLRDEVQALEDALVRGASSAPPAAAKTSTKPKTK